VARKVIKAEPLFGVGVGAYSAAHFEYSQQPDIRRTAHGYRDTHSTFLNVAAEMGYPGLVLFLLTFGMVAVRAERVRRRARLVTPRTAQQLLFLELGLLAFFVAGVFGSYAHLAFAWIHLVLLWTFAESTAAEAAALEGGARRAAPAAAVRAAGWRTAGARA
jgi:O-antigen ligase